MTNRDPAQAAFTPRQGQYLAFIYYYTKLNRVPPAEADFVRYFGVSAPTVHQMIVEGLDHTREHREQLAALVGQ